MTETLFDSWQVNTGYYLQVVMIITSKIFNLSQVAKGYE